tara:strand:- start:1071 stop:1247 length:177 start_codon:yes stop_codon:yes gene_type:complete
MKESKMPMVEKDGKMVPEFAADGIGKMKEGGIVKYHIEPRKGSVRQMERRGYGAARKP